MSGNPAKINDFERLRDFGKRGRSGLPPFFTLEKVLVQADPFLRFCPEMVEGIGDKYWGRVVMRGCGVGGCEVIYRTGVGFHLRGDSRQNRPSYGEADRTKTGQPGTKTAQKRHKNGSA